MDSCRPLRNTDFPESLTIQGAVSPALLCSFKNEVSVSTPAALAGGLPAALLLKLFIALHKMYMAVAGTYRLVGGFSQT